ncbi:MAG: hypothetical protein KGL53_01170, partial [Elusimicrobia bacterium]|nr:hypothetical protein [Elusimicrobiota bacterium]
MSGQPAYRLVRRVGAAGGLYAADLGGSPPRRFEVVESAGRGGSRLDEWSVWVSVQSGCAVGCAHCDAGEGPYGGNATAAELLEQVRVALSSHPEVDPSRVRAFKLRFARIGEPTFNDGVLEALETLARGGALPSLVPSVSTVAPDCAVSASFLERLRGLKERSFPGGRFRLQFSLHSTDPAARRALVPVRTWGFERMAEFGRRWRRPGDRRVALNVVSARAVPFDPDRLA